MRTMPALALGLSLLLGGCSSLTLGYNQLPRLLGWWIDGYFDLDRAQRAQLDEGLLALQRWHRREELPRWQALLTQAEAALSGGVRETELLTLEAQFNASLRRTLEHAAPLAGPWLASLRPAQWERLRARRAERLAEWRDEESERSAAERRDRLGDSLARWLGRLDRELRAELPTPPAPDAALWAEREARQRLAEQGLRAWAAGEHEAGQPLLMQAMARDAAQLGPATLAQRRWTFSMLPRLLAHASDAQWARTRERWADWRQDLAELQAER